MLDQVGTQTGCSLAPVVARWYNTSHEPASPPSSTTLLLSQSSKVVFHFAWTTVDSTSVVLLHMDSEFREFVGEFETDGGKSEMVSRDVTSKGKGSQLVR
jgi:hypothetical protein